MDSTGLTGVVCDDRPDVRRSVVGLLVGCGYRVAGEVDTFRALLGLVRTARPTVVVLSLPLAGVGSLAAVSAVQRVAPTCQVVVLSSFEQLQLAALEAGATALVAEGDPRALRAVLVDLAAAATNGVTGTGVAGTGVAGGEVTGSGQVQDEALVVAQAAAHGLGERPADRQAETRTPAPVQAHEALEDRGPVRTGEPRPVVPHPHLHPVVGDQHGEVDPVPTDMHHRVRVTQEDRDAAAHTYKIEDL